ncbi:MAG: DNA-formamidopyrimidine glycosylase [candidate division KSB1 bacterium]|nr:DNA-formamidopyrimidine glycosylase [candidate division KSB1 bacterium]MDZ7302882.1 DNA-formamidopyrimidine glycosylase [candidate division KSB1 bacterium]MDZ7310458.1 DNA-formamidopyrimidine glycosylase [candidate division KSB1 bacterium]
MPELPDLVYLEKRLSPLLAGQRIVGVEINEPIVIRMLLPGDFAQTLIGAQFVEVRRHGPFLIFTLSEARELIIHPMLAGRFQWTKPGGKIAAGCALSLECEPPDGRPGKFFLHYLDDKKMGKIYLTHHGEYEKIPRFQDQGPDLLSAAFSLEYFCKQIQKSRKQVRALIMDQTVVSCIGNAYADEILFWAGIHPKTFCHQLDEAEINKLHHCIVEVMRWGITEVEKANPPLEGKAREFMRVRNRKDQPCPRCGARIRRAGVRGYDTFFCPTCQPSKRAQFIDWGKLS